MKPELNSLIIAASAYWREKLDDGVVRMYAEDLEDLPIESVKEALREMRRDPKVLRFPLPSVIRAKIQPEATIESLAREAVDKIKIAIRSFGYMRSEDAREYLGEDIWTLVRGQGGWDTLCNSQFIDDAALQAQVRNRAADVLQFPTNPETGFLLSQRADRRRAEIEAKKKELQHQYTVEMLREGRLDELNAQMEKWNNKGE